MTRAKDISKILTDANISGTLDVTGETTLATHLNLGDNDKIKLGASADLQIYHNGSASYISEQGTGNLVLGAADSIIFQNAAHDENMLVASQNGAVSLYHDNSIKIATTSGGVTVTGGVTTTTASSIEGGVVFNESSADVDFRVESNGDANMLFVDGGNDRIGIGTNSPQKLLHLKDGDIVVGNGTASNNAVIGRVGFSTDSSNSRFIGMESFRGGDAANGDLRFHTFGGDSDNGERLRIDTAGRVQLGATLSTHIGTSQLFINRGVNSLPATSGTTQSGGALRLRGNDNAVLDMGMNSVNTWIQATDRANLANGYPLYLNPNGGNVAIGTSDTTYTNIGRLVSNCNLASFHTAVFRNDTNNTGGLFLRMMNHAGQDCGSISQSGTTTVSYATSSDYRLKENVSYDFDATSRLKQLKPARFNFIADADTTVDGFLAHEVSSIVPEAIIGTKDGTRDIGTLKDADGNVVYENVFESAKEEGQTWTKTATENVYQGIDQSKIVPLLVKTIQELEARITALESA